MPGRCNGSTVIGDCEQAVLSRAESPRSVWTSMNDAAASAALTICEAILLTLVEEKIIDRDRIQEILEDAVEAHLLSNRIDPDNATREKAARLIEEIVISLNGIVDRKQA